MGSVAVMGLAGCGGGATGGTPAATAQPASGLANLDPCKIATAQQLSADGRATQGTVVKQLDAEPGCSFKGNDVDVAFFKNQTQTVASYQTNGRWDDYTTTSVNGRTAARAQGVGVKGNGGCTLVMDAGGGVVLIQVTDPDKSDDQVCAEALQYAQQIEPNLPK